MSKTIIDRLIEHDLEDARARLRRFQASLERDAAHAFEWSEADFSAAATLRVFGTIRRHLDSGTVTVAGMRELAQREVNAAARRGSKSTSEPSNLMRDELMSAWARALEILQHEEPAP